MSYMLLGFSVILICAGLIMTLKAQRHLIRGIRKWSGGKALVGILPLNLLLLLKFDRQVRIICRNYPVQRLRFQRGLFFMMLGLLAVLINVYMLEA
jgi:hypothetical protein